MNPKNSVMICVEPLRVMVLRRLCAVAIPQLSGRAEETSAQLDCLLGIYDSTGKGKSLYLFSANYTQNN